MTIRRNLLIAVVALAMSAGTSRAGDYELVMKSAKIADTKASGAGWDPIGAPDPFVIAGIRAANGKDLTETGKTKVASDTYRPDWNETVLTVDIGDDIVLQVWDKDLQFDDGIGEYKFTVTKKMIEDGEARVSFDQVTELRFVLRKK